MMKKTVPTPKTQKIISFLASARFFRIVIGLLVVQAAWIAISSRYPMAFDEDFHLGIIRLYAHHILPFWSGQPNGADSFGAVYRDPSYLYHYLMSFPYRLIILFTHNQTAEVLWLRSINIVLAALSLVMYRKLLLKTGASRALVHGTLLIYVLLPVVSQLSAQINYDNLLLVLVPWSLLLTLKFTDELRTKQRVDAKMLLVLASVCLLTSLVKYAYLPILMALVLYVLAVAIRHHGKQWRQLWVTFLASFRALSTHAKWLLVVLFVLACGLFFERDGINTIRYHTPLASCGKVLGVQRCQSYGPWVRDYDYAQNKTGEESKSPVEFTADWFHGMWLRIFFAVAGPDNDFETRGPLPVPSIGAVVIVIGGLLAAALTLRRILTRYQRPVLGLFLIVGVCYVVTLWLDGYQSFVKTGQAVAINGRYLFPVIMFIMLFAGMGLVQLFRRYAGMRVILMSASIILLAWGGGVTTYILRSKPSWYWDNRAIVNVNHGIKETIKTFIPGATHPTEFL